MGTENNQGSDIPAGNSLLNESGRDRRLRLLLEFCFAVFFWFIANRLVGSITFAWLGGRHPLVADAIYRILTLVLLFLCFGYIGRYVDGLSGDLFQIQGLPLQRSSWKQAAIGFLLGCGLITLAVVAIAWFGELDVSATLNASTARHGVLVVALLLAGAMLEELMFRGYPFQRLVEAVGPWFAVAVVSVLFGAEHLENPNAGGVLSWGFFNTIAVGVLLSVAYLRTGSLWLSFGFHFAWNFALGLVFGLPVSGISMFSVVVRSHATGSKLLTGGNYGIESSLTGAVIIVIGIVVLLVLPLSKQAPCSPEQPDGG